MCIYDQDRVKMTRGFAIFLIVVIGTLGVSSQENAIKNLSPSLLECYEGDLYEKWNLLPHNIEMLIAIIRKIENYPGLNMDMRTLSAAILHRFRQDGIVKNPTVKPQVGVMPYAPLGKQFFRHAQTLRVIPGSAVNFPNNSISALERCTLHSMLSSSVDIFERGDESRVCKAANYAFGRFRRTAGDLKDDVETLSPEQLEMMSKNEGGPDPNSQYPALPPNHPDSAKLTNLPPYSRCPTENGVVKTPWGTVSGGSVLAGIAAGLEPQMIRIGELIRQQVEPRVLGYPSEKSLDNKFLGTLAGDLAEVALLQGPQQVDRYYLGAEGNWNSTSLPLYYFLDTNENLQMTAAEIRGDLDGLILANRVPLHYSKYGGLKLSQVLDMYYSDQGLFEWEHRACNRRIHFLTAAPTETLVAQTHSAALVLSTGIAPATFSNDVIEKFATQAVKDLSTLIPTMNQDVSCEQSRVNDDPNEPAVDIKIILDTTWPIDTIRPILAQLLSGLTISKFNSNVTLINAYDGSLIVNTTDTILDVYSTFNSSEYEKYAKGFDLSKSLESLRALQTRKLNEEQRIGWAGGKSDVVLFVPYQSTVSQNEKEYQFETLKTIREEVPDAVILFLTYGSTDRWFDMVNNPKEDVFSINVGETTNTYPSVNALQTRIKQVPRRLINTQCGANYDKLSTSSRPVTDYVRPNGVNYYRIHPNYFSSDDTENPPRIKIQGFGVNSLRVCTSRELIYFNSSAADCTTVMSNTHTVQLSCEDTTYLHKCKPYYVSVGTNSSTTVSYSCTDGRVCRRPDNIKYTISFDNLVCKSGSSSITIAPLILLISILRIF